VDELIPMELVDVRIDQATNNPVVLLRVDAEHRSAAPEGHTLLPIFIGVTEAQAIRIGIEGRATPRPMTHDLLGAVIEASGAEVQRIVITHMVENIFYAEIVLAPNANPDAVSSVSSRPSDAIALAVRVGCPVFANRQLLADHALADPTEDSEGGDPDELLDEFRQFLDDINPDDFNG
jgi:uncharacterized protein